MEDSTYNETFLPLRFFLNQVAVHCPSCNKKGYVKTDIPPVAEQEKIFEVFVDCGTYYSPYRWSTACFLCCSCSKRIEFDKASSLKTWHGPIIATAEASCPACMALGYKQRIPAKKTVIKKAITLPTSTKLSCNKCNTKVDAEWKYTPNYSAMVPTDPIFGLALFAQQTLGKHIVWVYNCEHLNHMKAYIQATQRKTSFTILTGGHGDLQRLDSRHDILSFSQTLPTWMKAKSNRSAVLKALEDLKQKV